MNDPPRLLDAGASAAERELLNAWRATQPSPQARARARGLAGGVVGAVGVAVVAASASKTAGVAGASSMAPTVAIGAGGLAKWAVGAALVALAGVGAAVGYLEATTPTPAPLVVAVSPSPRVVEATAVVATSAPAPREAPPPTFGAPTPQATGEHGSSPHRARPAATELSRELESLEHVRQALATPDATLALSRLDSHDASFPKGALREEASVLRVHALFASGKGAEGHRAAAAFLARYPSSPHAGRIRALGSTAAP